MSPLLWRSRSHLFLNPFLLPPITFVYISPFYHHATVSSPKVLTNCLFSPYSETADFNHDGALLHSHPRSTAADKIYQRYILTCLPRRHIQTEDFNPAETKTHLTTSLSCVPRNSLSHWPSKMNHMSNFIRQAPHRKTWSGILTPSKKTIGTTRKDV